MESAGKTARIEPEHDARRACGRERRGVCWRGDRRGGLFVVLIPERADRGELVAGPGAAGRVGTRRGPEGARV